MFLRKQPSGEPTIVQSPSPTSGLYIRTRGGALTKVSIPADSLAFQTGEALELATAGKLRATPHCVRVGAAPDAEKISRETFALRFLATAEGFGAVQERDIHVLLAQLLDQRCALLLSKFSVDVFI